MSVPSCHPRALLAALLALVLLAPAGVGVGAAAPADKVGWSTGYYPGWQQPGYPPGAIPWGSLTHLVHFSLLTGAARDGSLDTSAHGLTPQLMREAVAAAHSRGKQILIAVGGAEDHNWDAACDATNRPTFIANLVGVVRQYGYDGIDLDIEQDWQSPAHTDYVACVAGLRAALDALAPRPLLTAPGDPDWQAYMLAQVWQYLDQINLMDYWRDAAAIAAGLDNYTGAGIPRARLGVGIGIGDGGTDGANPADCAAKARAALAGGYGGVMAWTVPADAALHNGQTPCFDALAPYVATASPTPTPTPSPTPSPTPRLSPTPGPSPVGSGSTLPGLPNTGVPSGDRLPVGWLVLALGGVLVVGGWLLRRGRRRA
jgi:chitinase